MERLILKVLPKDREKLLTSRGVSPADFIHGKERFDVIPNLVKYDVELPRMPGRAVGTAKQIRALESICTNPLRSSYVLGISSFPSDALAKYLAIHIFNAAQAAWVRRHKPGRSINENLRGTIVPNPSHFLKLLPVNGANLSLSR
jgi:hypothetical protein